MNRNNSSVPYSNAKTIILSCEAVKAAAEIVRRGINVLYTTNNPSLPITISSHADLNCLYLGNGTIAVLEEQQELISILRARGFTVFTVGGAGMVYPFDCKLNCLFMRDFCLSHETALNGEIRRFLFNREVHQINSKQGYSRCSVAVVSNNAVITADMGLARLLEGQGIEVLLVPFGEIRLKGYDSGFIGGSCFLIENNELSFFGKVSETSFYKDIKDFCNKNDVEITELTDEPLTDCGGAVIID